MKIINKHKSTPEEQKSATYIGRGSPFGNPYVIGKHGDRTFCIKQYGPYLWKRLLSRDKVIEDAFKKLTDDTVLLCFCHPHPCHGQIITQTWETFFKGRDYQEGLALLQEHVTSSEADTPSSKAELEINPSEDGVTHINVYSRGKTELGKLLSNFAHTPFEHPEHGHFSSVEGFWYWLSTGKNQTQFRGLYGFKAKEVGKLVRNEQAKTNSFVHIDGFKAEIKKAILCKIEQNEHIRTLLKESTLPLTHYYVYGEPGNQKVSKPLEYFWIHEYISDVRDWLNGKAFKLLIAGGREFTDAELTEKSFRELGITVIEIVSGMARGADLQGEELAKKLELPVAKFPAQWNKVDENGNEYTDKSAGYTRNVLMGDYADHGLLFWDGVSKGTMHMRDILIRKKKPYKLVLF